MFVENINDYVLDLVKGGESVIRTRKTATVKARKGIAGEVIETEIDKTLNTVKADEEGCADWVVTSKGGE